MKLSPATRVVLLATVGLLVLAFDLRHERDLLITEFEAEREVGWPFHSQFWEPTLRLRIHRVWPLLWTGACGPHVHARCQKKILSEQPPGVSPRW